MSQPLISVSDGRGRLAEGIACYACGYNLFSLDPSGECPECGVAVKRSIWVSRFHGCDAGWLRRLASGCFWSVVGLGTIAATAVCYVVLLMATRATQGLWVWTYNPAGSAAVMAVIFATLMVGGWKTTTLVPVRNAPWRAMQLAARVLVIGPLVATAAIAFAIWRVLLPDGPTRRIDWLMDASRQGIAISVALGVGTVLVYMGLLARRMGSRNLAAMLWITLVPMAGLWGLTLVMVGVGSGSTWAWLTWLSGRFIVEPLQLHLSITFECAGALASALPVVVCCVWLIVLLGWLRQRLLDAAKVAGRVAEAKG